MFSRSLLLVLLVLACLQSNNALGPDRCCYSYQTRPIPVRLITGYKVTDHHCTKPAFVFTLKSGRRVCADPGVQWVQKHMEKLDPDQFESLEIEKPAPPPVRSEPSANGPGTCCFSYQTRPIPVRLITKYEVTERQCAKRGVIFTLNIGRRLCAGPGIQWVQDRMKIIDQRLIS